MTTELRHEAGRQRYTYWVDGDEVGLTDYRLRGDAVDIVHTEIDPPRRGAGLGARMVRSVLDEIRAAGQSRVIPSCPFVADFIDEHPDYQDLLTR